MGEGGEVDLKNTFHYTMVAKLVHLVKTDFSFTTTLAEMVFKTKYWYINSKLFIDFLNS